MASPIINKNTKILNQLSQINLWISEYDDFFSDFDPSPYAKRTLSEDFLYELKRISNQTKFTHLDIAILVPEKIRNNGINKIVKKRLWDYFSQQYASSHLKKKKLIISGIIFFLTGSVFMLTSTFLTRYENFAFFVHFFIVLLELVGWFSIWQALDILIFETKELNVELEFYDKLNESEIKFLSY